MNKKNIFSCIVIIAFCNISTELVSHKPCEASLQHLYTHLQFSPPPKTFTKTRRAWTLVYGTGLAAGAGINSYSLVYGGYLLGTCGAALYFCCSAKFFENFFDSFYVEEPTLYRHHDPKQKL